jgi:hypothetical protein
MCEFSSDALASELECKVDIHEQTIGVIMSDDKVHAVSVLHQ